MSLGTVAGDPSLRLDIAAIFKAILLQRNDMLSPEPSLRAVTRAQPPCCHPSPGSRALLQGDVLSAHGASPRRSLLATEFLLRNQLTVSWEPLVGNGCLSLRLSNVCAFGA